MKNVKNNNKGFSLVELIVVVLIMAILAVALAPQVMKWVDNSRISSDLQTKDAVVSAFQLALTDADAYKIAKAASGTEYICTTSIVNTNDALSQKAAEYLGTTTVSLKTADKLTITVSGGAISGKIFSGTNELTEANVN